MNSLSRKSRVYRCRRGMAVVLVIGFIVVATAILSLSIQQFVAGKRLARARWDRVQVDQWMESALERALELRKKDEGFPGDRWSITPERLDIDRHELSVEKQAGGPPTIKCRSYRRDIPGYRVGDRFRQ